jgi:hypothetical protein
MPWLEIVAGVIIVAIPLVLLVRWFWWRLPKRQLERLPSPITDPKACADVEDNFRKTNGQFLAFIGQLLAFSAVLFGAGVALYQTLLTLRASHEQLISQQVSKGFELLGEQDSNKTLMRLGGIYALEGVMKTSEQYHQPILEALSAFVRDGTRTVTNGPPAVDIQSALTVIGKLEAGTGIVDLHDAHIPRAHLFEAKLIDANMTGADLTHTDLRHAKLNSATLNGANLNDADLTSANLSDADLIGAHLRRAHLTGAKMNRAALINADLSGAILSGTNLSDAIVSQSQLDKACGDGGTKLPAGLTLKLCSP